MPEILRHVKRPITTHRTRQQLYADSFAERDRTYEYIIKGGISSAREVGSEIRAPKSADALGRISAQTTKRVIIQRVREAEREIVFHEFSVRADGHSTLG